MRKRQNQEKNTGNTLMRVYLKEVRKIPLLTIEEEKELGRRTRMGDVEAFRKLIESNLRFVIQQAKKYAQSPNQYLELISAGNLGLIEAARRFDPDQQVRFISYAFWWIRQAIFQQISSASHPFSLPPKAATLSYQLGRLRGAFLQYGHAENLTEEFATALNMSSEDVDFLINAAGASISMNQQIDADGVVELSETLEQTCFPSPEECSMTLQLRRDIDRSIGFLKPIEQMVIRRRFGLDSGFSRSLHEIGKDLNLSRERIRQIQVNALRKLHDDSTLHCYVH